MMEDICPKYGHCFVGWALRFSGNQMCSNCGATLQTYQDDKRVLGGYSSFIKIFQFTSESLWKEWALKSIFTQ